MAADELSVIVSGVVGGLSALVGIAGLISAWRMRVTDRAQAASEREQDRAHALELQSQAQEHDAKVKREEAARKHLLDGWEKTKEAYSSLQELLGEMEHTLPVLGHKEMILTLGGSRFQEHREAFQAVSDKYERIVDDLALLEGKAGVWMSPPVLWLLKYIQVQLWDAGPQEIPPPDAPQEDLQAVIDRMLRPTSLFAASTAAGMLMSREVRAGPDEPLSEKVLDEIKKQFPMR